MEMEKEEQLILKSLRWKGKGLAKGAQDSSKLQTDSLDGVFFCIYICYDREMICTLMI